MTFVRYLNVSDTKKKVIGFSISGSQEDIFDFMLLSICDFTLPGSTCNVYYQLQNGEVRFKKLIKKTGTKFYINGDRKLRKGIFLDDMNKILRACRQNHFNKNL